MKQPKSLDPSSSSPDAHPWLKFYDDGVPATIQLPDMPLHGLLEEAAKRFPTRAATIYFGASLSFSQMNDLADSVAAALRSMGIKKGDRVATLLPNCPQMVATYYGALKLGAILVPTNPLYVERELEYQLNDAGVETVVTLSKFYPTLEKVRDRTGVRRIIVANIKDYMPAGLKLLFTLFKERKEGHRVALPAGSGVTTFNSLVSGSPAQPLHEDVKPDDIALLLYTGGTTGISKGAVLTHRNLVSNAIQVKSWMPKAREGGEVTLAALPFFHVYGMTSVMNYCMAVGSTMVLIPRFQPEEVLQTISKYRPTLFPGVPTMYVALINNPNLPKYDLKCIRYCISGGAPLPVEVQNKFEALTGAKLVEGYGLTEASPVTHVNPLDGERRIGTIGVPCPSTDARVVDLATGRTPLPPGEIGELAVRGPQVMQGYWNRPEETANVLPGDGWLRTGDMATMDTDGFFSIVDRKKDLVIAGGYNIYPREIEEVLYEHPKVKEAVAAGVPDPYRGETVKVYIVLKSGMTATEDEIIQFCSERLAKFKVPKLVEFRDELPKTLVGKVLRRALVEEEMKKQAAGPQ